MPHIARKAAASINGSPADYATQSGSSRVCERSAVVAVSRLHLFGFCFAERLASIGFPCGQLEDPLFQFVER